MKLITPYKDIKGKDIYVGDIIRFYASADYGYSEKQKMMKVSWDDKKHKKYTEMIDLVIVDKDEFYVYNLSIGGFSYLNRCAYVCEVIGNAKDNPEIIEKEKKWLESL